MLSTLYDRCTALAMTMSRFIMSRRWPTNPTGKGWLYHVHAKGSPTAFADRADAAPSAAASSPAAPTICARCRALRLLLLLLPAAAAAKKGAARLQCAWSVVSQMALTMPCAARSPYVCSAACGRVSVMRTTSRLNDRLSRASAREDAG